MNLLNSGKLKYHNVTLNKLITHIIPIEHQNFTRNTIELIMSELLDLWWGKYDIFNIPPLEVFRRLAWRWGHPDGTFTQRLTKAIKAAWDLNIPESILTQIGNLARNDSIQASEVHFDITQNLNWKNGDFGDSGSCFWSGRKEIRSAMEKEGNFYAIRIFGADRPAQFLDIARDMWGRMPRENSVIYYPNFKGVGRSWLYETTVSIGALNLPVLIIFNSYGVNISTQSLILASYLNRERGHCTLHNKGKTHGGLYVNGPGYIIGVPMVTKTVNRFDFGLNNCYDEISDAPTRTPLIQPNGTMVKEKNYFKPLNKKARKQMRANQLREKQTKVAANDTHKGILHQRYLELLSQQSNKSWLRNVEDRIFYVHRFERTGMKPEQLELKEKLDSLRPLYKKFQYDPIKIIHHHIKNHLL
jgi:hypothetical protein